MGLRGWHLSKVGQRKRRKTIMPRPDRTHSMESLLFKVRERIRSLENARHLEYWLQDVEVAEESPGDLTLKCPNAFSVQWLSGRHGEALSDLFNKEAGRDVHLTFQVDRPPASSNSSDEPGAAASSGRPSSLPPQGHAETGETSVSAEPFTGWNPRFRFSTFVTGPSNRFAWSAANEVARQCRSEYNPLLIHSSTGLGKTHLGQAIGQRLFEGDRNLRILWRTAESFFAEMIRHIRDKDVPAFKKKYRDACDVLILDDIQFLKGKTALQAELCHTLDILLNRGKRVVLLGNLPARGKNGLEEGLESRIFSGLTTTMEAPEYETRLAIISQFAKSSGVSVPEETLAVVARRVRSHVRDLEGAFKRLVAMRSLSHQELDPETVDRLFRTAPYDSGRPLDRKTIQDHVGRYFAVDPALLASRSRKRNVLYPRQIGMYLTRKHTHESLESIGHLYGRDHASVLHAIRSLEEKMGANARVAREVQFIENKLLEDL
jgi:chromosomal replication initiator protein